MAVIDKPNEQILIVYGNKYEKKIYTTAYTKDQANEALMKCLERFGRNCQAKIVYSSEIGSI